MTDSTVLGAGLLVLRLVLAFTFFAHGAQKLLGWFSGAGLEASGAAFERMGQRPGKPMAMLAAGSEFASCALLGLGLLMPLGVTIGLGTMIVAGSSLTQSSRAFWNSAGGGEYPFFIGFVLASLSLLGPGTLSLDAAFGFPWYDLKPSAMLALAGATIGCAVTAALLPILRGRTG